MDYKEKDSFVRAKGVAELISVSVTTVYHMLKTDPKFPKPIALGPRMIVWSKNGVHDYIEGIKASSRQTGLVG
ncbi:MAG: AlpA family phage regulatory protein [Deltaproteobacteria bacterium]|jgi:predicted DNA-binding transcriptional regulator AlpA|nr:AlpA family phage regulatory protein [Deltaproteobacteria bacterium]